MMILSRRGHLLALSMFWALQLPPLTPSGMPSSPALSVAEQFTAILSSVQQSVAGTAALSEGPQHRYEHEPILIYHHEEALLLAKETGLHRFEIIDEGPAVVDVTESSVTRIRGPLKSRFLFTGMDVLQQLGEHGLFAPMEAGETLALFCLRSDLDFETISLVNRLPGDQRLPGHLVCIRHEHHVHPDETVQFLAGLYNTDVETLRRINDLKAPEEFPAWSKALVPVTMRPCEAIHGRRVLWQLDRVIASHQMEQMGPTGAVGLQPLDHLLHIVEEKETPEDIANRYGCSPEMLRWSNSQPVSVGSKLLVGTRVPLRPGYDLSTIVLSLEYILQVDLDAVLKINELSAPTELMKQTELWIPLGAHVAQLQYWGNGP